MESTGDALPRQPSFFPATNIVVTDMFGVGIFTPIFYDGFNAFPLDARSCAKAPSFLARVPDVEHEKAV